MSQIIANQFTTRIRLLKGDLSKPSDELSSSVGIHQCVPGMSRPESCVQVTRTPPGFPFPIHRGLQRQQDMGTIPCDGTIGNTVAHLKASIVGCHRETVRRDIPFDNCPSSNLHYYVKSVPHTRHEPRQPVNVKTVVKGNKLQFRYSLSH